MFMDSKKQPSPISKACQGEICTLCASHNFSCKDGHSPTLISAPNPATHKVGEELLFDTHGYDAMIPQHNMTAYICCYHYKKLFNLKGCCHEK